MWKHGDEFMRRDGAESERIRIGGYVALIVGQLDVLDPVDHPRERTTERPDSIVVGRHTFLGVVLAVEECVDGHHSAIVEQTEQLEADGFVPEHVAWIASIMVGELDALAVFIVGTQSIERHDPFIFGQHDDGLGGVVATEESFEWHYSCEFDNVVRIAGVRAAE
jgi:hypothetical protein